LKLELPSELVGSLVRRLICRLLGDIGADGVTRLRLARFPGWGHLEVDVAVRGAVVRLKPRAVMLGKCRWQLPERMSAYPLSLPDLPGGFVITTITPQPGSLLVEGVLPQWRADLPRRSVGDLVGQLGTTGDVLNLARSAWRV
jgi:hypothetical protein